MRLNVISFEERKTMYLTVKEFANEIKMCPHSVRKSILEGKIFAVRFGVGKRCPFRIPRTELERIQVKERFENQGSK